MKRLGFLMSLLVLLAGSAMASTQAQNPTPEIALLTELPWNTVQAVFKKVADQGHYTYNFLVYGYDAGTVTVAQSGSGYLVTVNSDGIVGTILIDAL